LTPSLVEQSAVGFVQAASLESEEVFFLSEAGAYKYDAAQTRRDERKPSEIIEQFVWAAFM
jgi:hypothetical protein